MQTLGELPWNIRISIINWMFCLFATHLALETCSIIKIRGWQKPLVDLSEHQSTLNMWACIFRFAIISVVWYCAITALELSRESKGLRILGLLNRCNCRCGWSNRQDRILGGETTRQYEFPWLAYIRTSEKQIIPATLINDRYVITSASLLTGLTPFDIKILLGLQDRCNPDVSSIILSASSIKIHQLYGSLNRAHDLALIKLNGNVDFDRRISPICLPLQGRTHLGEVATVVGWTKNDNNDSLSNCRPVKLGLPVLGQRECLGTSPDQTYFSSDKACVGIVGASSPICKDDAGAPVMYRDKQGIYDIIGIFSDRNTCGPPPSTAMYTTLSRYISWIKENTLDACYCLKI